ncbi:GNAT family protein [uncultured Dokdonia sp.]|uniref:GNAT family N-acetyltransferase n=1 Tax=uncultured Dokdonia sp. TaxID=575653 RepID=UPI002627BD23|nr:GNAT family protein [uncultured Dokdonia sp.]
MNQEVNIRSLTLDDAQQLATLANNKKVWDNLRDYIPYPYNEKDAEFFINLTAEENPKQNFGIEYKGKLCGVIGVILQKDVYRKSGEIGYWIGEPYWGKGIGTKAVALITEYGFQTLGLHRIYAGIFDYNKASVKVLKKNGFEQEGIFKKAVFKNEKLHDEYRFYKLTNM